uniref:(northern house mosquito) hypothetical protein n=1 Tax=Culex pipiens TaxID=7175 RepID=A0A8D7ZWD7_CULPI
MAAARSGSTAASTPCQRHTHKQKARAPSIAAALSNPASTAPCPGSGNPSPSSRTIGHQTENTPALWPCSFLPANHIPPHTRNKLHKHEADSDKKNLDEKADFTPYQAENR